MDFSKFDKNVDLEGLKKDIDEAKEGNQTFKEVPLGTYEVKVTKLELTVSKSEKPMIAGRFKIIEGEFKGQYLFMNQVVTEGFQINIINELLKSFEVFEDEDIYFDGYNNYKDLLLDVVEEIEKQKLEYLLEYEETDKGFKTFKIKKVYRK
mgnify:CR=1 FL=1